MAAAVGLARLPVVQIAHRARPSRRLLSDLSVLKIAWWNRACQHPELRLDPFDSLRDSDSLIDILNTQAGGDLKRALSVLEEVVTAANGTLVGTTLERRYIALLAWYGDGCPRVARRTRSRELARYRQMVRENVGDFFERAVSARKVGAA